MDGVAFEKSSRASGDFQGHSFDTISFVIWAAISYDVAHTSCSYVDAQRAKCKIRYVLGSRIREVCRTALTR